MTVRRKITQTRVPEECSMINFRCSNEHSTLNIEHSGYRRSTRKRSESAITSDMFMNDAG
jgi:hypothetical protein